MGLILLSSPFAIEVERLSKTYEGKVTAVEDVSFQVAAGEVFGLLGPNGAGKTTTLRVLITVLRPTGGVARVLGLDVVERATEVRQAIGYVPQERAIDRFLTGREHLQLLASLYHIPKDQAPARIEAVLKLVNLEHKADEVARNYSGGMKRKLDIACGLIPDPKVLFMDEPTLGLDVESRLKIWEHIRQLKARGITILITTNYLDEADQLCDRIAIIDGGRVKAIGSPNELKSGLGGDIVTLTLAAGDLDKVEGLAQAVKGQAGVKAVSTKQHVLDIRVASPEAALPAILSAVTARGCRLEFVDYHRPRLDDVFLAHTGRRIKDE
ncbi:MAG: ATP-binding cassette domain-containing protein [Nitrospirae bacterium]|nr:MAG: ATP-binding cassette domain-containing protein [Nitrospirota bacterium]